MDTSGLELRFRIGSIPVVVEPWFWLSGLMLNMQSMHCLLYTSDAADE